MITALKLSNWAMLSLMCGVVAAQESPPATPLPGSNAQSEAGEPRASLSTTPEPAPAATAKSRPSASTAAGPEARVPTSGATSTGSARRPGAKVPDTADRLNLGAATVTGDHEQPKVMYIVPWKGSNIGDLSGKPMNSLLDEALAPVDRDEFKREVAYYDAVRAHAPQSAGAAPPAQQSEK